MYLSIEFLKVQDVDDAEFTKRCRVVCRKMK